MSMELLKELSKKVSEAKASGGGNNIRHGNYVLLLKRLFVEKKFTGRCCIIEFKVHEAQKIEVFEGDKKVEQEPNAVGSECSVVINFDGKAKESAPGNMKAFILGLFGFSEDQVTQDDVNETFMDFGRTTPEVDEKGTVLKEANPGAGLLIRCSTFSKAVRSAPGKYITGLNWNCVATPFQEGSENSREKVEERRKTLTSTK